MRDSIGKAIFASRMLINDCKSQVSVNSPHVTAGASRNNIDLECCLMKDTRLDACLLGYLKEGIERAQIRSAQRTGVWNENSVMR